MMCESDEIIHVVASSSATDPVGAVIVMVGSSACGIALPPEGRSLVSPACPSATTPSGGSTPGIGRPTPASRHRSSWHWGRPARWSTSGAGTGAYEPRDRVVTAVEPSTVMIEQRAPDAAPVVRVVAETLPFPDDTFDVALGTFTVHHWTDAAAGLREVQRVARAAGDPHVRRERRVVRPILAHTRLHPACRVRRHDGRRRLAGVRRDPTITGRGGAGAVRL